jgi:hypothetical protein
MAGQTPEPSFQPAGQDPGLTQGRPAWHVPPGYPPSGGSSGAGGGAGQAYAAPAPSYGSPEQGYPPQDQTYTVLGQNPGQPGQDYQDYQGYQQAYQGYGAPQGQDQGAGAPPPHWQGAAGVKHVGRTKSASDKGLIGSLFDFSFASMVTPKIIKALYILFTVWTAFAAIGIFFFFLDTGGLSGALAALIIVDPIFILLSLGVYRVILEAFMVIFQIHGELKTIREQGENRA